MKSGTWRLALGLILAVALAACSSSPNAPPTTSTAPPRALASTEVSPSVATATLATLATAPPAGSAYTPRAPLDPPVKVSVVDTGIVANIPVYAGIDRGYFRDEGLDVTLIAIPDASTAAQMIATNQAQFHTAIPDPVIFNALARGVNLKLLVSSTTNAPTDRPAAVIVRQDLIDSGRYRTPADFKGMTIGAGSASSQFYVAQALSRGGLTLADANIVNVGSLPDMLTALQNRSIDAAWEVEPLITGAERQGLARAVLATGELEPGAVGAALVMAPSFEADNPEAAVRFLIAYLRGQRDYYHALNKKDVDPTSVIQSLTTHTLVKDPNLYRAMGLPSLPPNGQMDVSTWDPFQQFYVDQGILSHKVDLSPYLDTQLVNQALDRLGREPES